MMLTFFIRQQTGAMFGLDARISLAIFGVLSIVAGGYAVLGMSSIQANSLSKELTETAVAIESIHNDIEYDLHMALENPSDENAFKALFDDSVLQSGKFRAHWLGPYIRATSSVHPKYGDMRIIKRLKDHKYECGSGEDCYLYLVYAEVSPDTVDDLNGILDGAETEHDPATTGRVQWDEDDENHILFYRASRSLSGNYGY